MAQTYRKASKALASRCCSWPLGESFSRICSQRGSQSEKLQLFRDVADSRQTIGAMTLKRVGGGGN